MLDHWYGQVELGRADGALVESYLHGHRLAERLVALAGMTRGKGLVATGRHNWPEKRQTTVQDGASLRSQPTWVPASEPSGGGFAILAAMNRARDRNEEQQSLTAVGIIIWGSTPVPDHRLRRHPHRLGQGGIPGVGLHPHRSGELPSRLKQVYDGVSEIITQFKPDEFAIERVFMARNADSALKLGQAREVPSSRRSMPAAGERVFGHPDQAGGGGHRWRRQEQVQHMVTHLLKLSATPRRMRRMPSGWRSATSTPVRASFAWPGGPADRCAAVIADPWRRATGVGRGAPGAGAAGKIAGRVTICRVPPWDSRGEAHRAGDIFLLYQ